MATTANPHPIRAAPGHGSDGGRAVWRRPAPMAAPSAIPRLEADLSATMARLEASQKTEVERAASSRMAVATDLSLTGAKVGDMLSESGEVDLDKVGRAVSATLKDHPNWGKPEPFRGMRSGAEE